MYSWLVEATTQHPDNSSCISLQIRFQPCTQLNRDSAKTMFIDLDETFEDTGTMTTLLKELFLHQPEQQQESTNVSNNKGQAPAPWLEAPVDSNTAPHPTTTLVTTSRTVAQQQLNVQLADLYVTQYFHNVVVNSTLTAHSLS